MKLPKAENLASWENEGGASAPEFVQPVARPGRAAHADNEASDTDALAIMRISLLLLIPAIGGGAIYWGLLVGSASQ